MLDLLSASIGYISIIKFVIFLLFFIVWLPLLRWVYQDAEAFKEKRITWIIVIFAAGAVVVTTWLFLPFIIGLIVYIVILGAASLVYIKYRNSQVSEFERILTIDHIKNLMTNKEKKLEALKGFVFITANKNEVPVPEPRTADYPGYKMSFDMIKDATWRRAENVVITPTPQDYKVAYNIDGSISEQSNIPKEQAEILFLFLKHLADLDPKEKRKPQTGIFRIHRNKETHLIEWEVATAGSTAGEQLKLTLLTKADTAKVERIGLMPEQHGQLNKFDQIKKGLFIISGPEKSGVTSTFYAMLRNHDAFLNNIYTLERQPSQMLPNITQEIHNLSDSGTVTFAKKLQSIVRMEPDIIGVADCEDSATAQVASAAAAEGKLVYVTLKANSVIEAYTKWMKLVGNRNAVARSLLGISNQRLIRRLCNECKEAYAPDKDLLRKFNISAEKTKALYRAGKFQYDKRGKPSTCEQCQGTGYLGRTAVFEMVIINSELAKAIQSLPMAEIGKQFRKAKMLYLQEQILRKVVNGTTTINEMIRVLKKKETKKTQ